MPNIPSSSLFETEIKIISLGVFAPPSWHEENRIPRSYWRLYWNNSKNPWNLIFSGEKSMVSRNVLVLIPPSTGYIADAGLPISMLHVFFEAGKPYDTVVARPKIYPLDKSSLLELEELWMAFSGNGFKINRYALVHYFISKTLLRLEETDFLFWHQMDERISRILLFINEHYALHLTNQMLCKKLNMSMNNFLRLFRKEAGQSPHTYINYIRIRNARRLLRETSLPIDVISEETGFTNRYHFSRNFYRNTRISPARYRAMMAPRHPEVKMEPFPTDRKSPDFNVRSLLRK